VIIRRASSDDLHALVDISHQGGLSAWSEEAFVSALQLAWSRVLVAENASEVWGYVVFWLVDREMEILHLATHPSQHRRGIGRALLSSVMEMAHAQSVTRVSLEVAENNLPARELYLKFGFAICGRRPAYYASIDALIMDFQPKLNL
jgi:[ribosomal protein S18]-alanine N-acetyltransferase